MLLDQSVGAGGGGQSWRADGGRAGRASYAGQGSALHSPLGGVGSRRQHEATPGRTQSHKGNKCSVIFLGR